MSAIILSEHDFRQEFREKIHAIAPDYQFVTDTQNLDWSQVILTIGWSSEWEKPLLAENHHLRWVQALSAGVDTLPLNTFANQNIQLSNASGIHAQAISEHVLAALLMDTRGFTRAVVNQRQHRWDAETIDFRYLGEQEVVIVGTGHIGQQLARLLQYFGVAPIGINTDGHPVAGFSQTYSLQQLQQVVPTADYIINILPLTKQTYHLYDEAFFQQMKKSGAFINVGRGPSVVTSALVTALQTGVIRQAILDVFEEEPLPAHHPLWSLANCVITPHVSGVVPHFQKVFMEIFLDNLQQFVTDGQLARNQVSLRDGY